jgi:cytochrome c6
MRSACNRHGYAIRLLLVLLLGCMFATLGWGESKSSPGQGIFKAKCMLCHGADGHGKTTLGQQLKAQDLSSPQVQSQKDAELKQVISHGQGNMPPFEEQLSAAQLDQVVGYIRSEFGKKKK